MTQMNTDCFASVALVPVRNGSIARSGKWKLVGTRVLRPEGPNIAQWELYDLSADRAERSNLAKKFPERVKAMHDQFDAHGHRTKILPMKRVGKDRKPSS